MRFLLAQWRGISARKLLEILREIVFPNNLNYTCVNDVYSDFIYRFAEAVNFIAPAKRIRMKAKSNPWLHNQIASAMQRRYKFYKTFKDSFLETDKENFKILTFTCRKRYWRTYFEEELANNRNKSKELWKALKLLGLSSEKARKVEISLKEYNTIQF